MIDITIIGGGIAGLTCALALQRVGANVRVFEQAAALEEVGAGLTLTQPASRGLFSLGLRAVIESVADVPSRAVVADYLTGAMVSGPDRVAQAKERGDLPYFYQIHRADLVEILADAVRANDREAIVLGARFDSLTQDSAHVCARFMDGREINSQFLIATDGINSRVRNSLIGHEDARFTGQVAYRFLVPYRDVAHYMPHSPSIHYVGPGRNLLCYRLRKGTLVNGVAFVRTDHWTGEGWSNPAEPGELLEQFQGWNDEVKGLLASAPLEGTRKWALFDRDPLARWTYGRATLMGDSAHPMLPFLGLGAAMAIEDAVVFARVWAGNHDKIRSLETYEALRRSRANHVLLASRHQGKVHQAEDGAKVERFSAATEVLTNYDPSTTPLAPADGG